MSNNKQSSVDAYCNGCNAFICDELVTFEETCSNCGTQIEYFEDKMGNNKQQTVVQQIVQALNIECKSRGIYVNWDMYLEMEKKRLKDAYWAGIDDHLNPNKMPNSEGYYELTFGGNK